MSNYIPLFYVDVIQGQFCVSYLEKAQAVLGQSQDRLLQWPGLWLAEHNLSLLWARQKLDRDTGLSTLCY